MVTSSSARHGRSDEPGCLLIAPGTKEATDTWRYGRPAFAPERTVPRGEPRRRLEEWSEEAEALNVVEVEMAEQHVDPLDASLGNGHTERAHASAGVEHQDVSARALHLDTRRVAAVPDGLGSRCPQRAAASSHPDFHDSASQNTVSTPCMSPRWPNRG